MERRKSKGNRHNSSGRQENNTIGSVDRISALPDSILSIILSFLLTKQAVATSILSKRFKFMWRTVHNLEFIHFGRSEERYEGEDMKFAEFVNHVLLLNDSGFLNKFYLFWKPMCIFSYVSSWIRTAITKNVQDLSICVEPSARPYSTPEPIEMPIRIFSCNTLRFMELNGGVYFSSEDVISLPCLESLKLFSVNFQLTNLFAKLISGCPMLNSLLLHIDTDYMTYCRISSTSLRYLALLVEKKDELRVDSFFCTLDLKTPSLEYLTLDGSFDEIYVEESLSSLVESNFLIDLLDFDFVEPSACNPVVEAVRALDCAKILNLSGDAMWAIKNATISLSTEFKKLEKFVSRCYCLHCCLLQDFIQSSDNLEELIIDQGRRTEYHTHHSNWNAPVEVPKCFSNSLKKVVLNDYCGLDDEREMIRYILKHGSVLEVMKIELSKDRDDSKFELIQEICMFPRKSPLCAVEFTVDQSIPDLVVSSSNSLSPFQI